MLFHDGVCGGLARPFVTFGGSGGTGRSCLTHVVPRPRLGTSILGGGSNVTG